MGLAEVNGHGVVEGRLWFPRSGAWHAELKVDSLDTIAGAVTISIADGRQLLKGTVWRGAEYVDTSFLNIVAGAGGLRTTAKAKGYNQASLSIVVNDLLGGAGERLAASADRTTMAKRLPSWTTAATSVGVALARAIASATPSASWRALADGTIWIGPEAWPDSGFTEGNDYVVISEDPRQGVAELGVEAPLLMAGTTLAGRRVSRVEHTIGSGGVRTWAWFEDVETRTAPIRDRLKEAIAGAVRAAAAHDPFQGLYWARVVAQNGGTIDVEIENPTIAKFLPSLQRIPLTMPAAGAAVQMAATGRVLVGWSGGDPAQPYAIGPDDATALIKLVLNAPQLLLGDTAAQPFPNFAYRNADASKNATLAAAFSALAAASTGPLSPLATQFTTIAGALTTFETGAPSYLTAKVKAT